MPLQVDTRHLNRIIANHDRNVDEFLRTVAFAIEGQAKINAPVDTGALRASIYTRIGSMPSTVPEVPGTPARGELPQPPNRTTAHIGPSVQYGLVVELSHSTHGGYLTRAVRSIGDQLIRQAAVRVAIDD